MDYCAARSCCGQRTPRDSRQPHGPRTRPFGPDKWHQFLGLKFCGRSAGRVVVSRTKGRGCECVIEVDMQRSENVRRWWPFLRDRRIEEFGPLAKRFID